MRTSEFESVKLGNKTPTSSDAKSGYTMWPSNEPMSQRLIDLWRERIHGAIDNMDLPYKLQGNLRGVYIGISAVFYAAAAAKCAESLLPKAAFIGRLDAKLADLLENPPASSEKNGEVLYDHRVFAN